MARTELLMKGCFVPWGWALRWIRWNGISHATDVSLCPRYSVWSCFACRKNLWWFPPVCESPAEGVHKLLLACMLSVTSGSIIKPQGSKAWFIRLIWEVTTHTQPSTTMWCRWKTGFPWKGTPLLHCPSNLLLPCDPYPVHKRPHLALQNDVMSLGGMKQGFQQEATSLPRAPRGSPLVSLHHWLSDWSSSLSQPHSYCSGPATPHTFPHKLFLPDLLCCFDL